VDRKKLALVRSSVVYSPRQLINNMGVLGSKYKIYEYIFALKVVCVIFFRVPPPLRGDGIWKKDTEIPPKHVFV
jgi:hypothetical protein